MGHGLTQIPTDLWMVVNNYFLSKNVFICIIRFQRIIENLGCAIFQGGLIRQIQFHCFEFSFIDFAAGVALLEDFKSPVAAGRV